MKKIILSMCLAAVALMGTTASAKTFGWGITGGLNVPKIDWENAESQLKDKSTYDADNGWYAGVTAMVSVPILGFGLDGAVLYSQEKISDENVQTISIPVHLRYDFNLPAVNKVIVPFVMAGPQFNYGLNDITLEGMTVGSIKEELKIDKANSWKLDLGVGVILLNHLQVSYGYGIPMGDTGKLKAGVESAGLAIDAAKNYKMATHRIGVAYYF